MTNRRDFIKKTLLTGAAAFTAPSLLHSENEIPAIDTLTKDVNTQADESNPLIVPKNNGLRITGTFLDEISHDIPHQNWGAKEWDQDFQYMKHIGIDTVILIRSGYRKFITYPSKYLLKKGCYMPSMDLVDLFLRLAQKYNMKFYFGLYDSGKYWDTGDLTWEKKTINMSSMRYGNSMVPNIKASEDGISVERSAGRPRELSVLFRQWGNNARMYQEGFQHLSHRG